MNVPAAVGLYGIEPQSYGLAYRPIVACELCGCPITFGLSVGPSLREMASVYEMVAARLAEGEGRESIRAAYMQIIGCGGEVFESAVGQMCFETFSAQRCRLIDAVLASIPDEGGV